MNPSELTTARLREERKRLSANVGGPGAEHFAVKLIDALIATREALELKLEACECLRRARPEFCESCIEAQKVMPSVDDELRDEARAVLPPEEAIK